MIQNDPATDNLNPLYTHTCSFFVFCFVWQTTYYTSFQDCALQPPNKHCLSLKSLKANRVHPVLTQVVFFYLKQLRSHKAEKTEEHRWGFTQAWTCKMYGFTFSLSRLICVSPPRLSLSASSSFVTGLLGEDCSPRRSGSLPTEGANGC